MNNTKTEMVKPADLRHNDTLLIDGHYYTIGREDTKGDLVMGIRFKFVERVLYQKWYQGKFVDWRTQL